MIAELTLLQAFSSSVGEIPRSAYDRFMGEPNENIVRGTENSEQDEDQIAERLAWPPKERLQYLLDMLAFEERAQRARRLS